MQSPVTTIILGQSIAPLAQSFGQIDDISVLQVDRLAQRPRPLGKDRAVAITSASLSVMHGAQRTGPS